MAQRKRERNKNKVDRVMTMFLGQGDLTAMERERVMTMKKWGVAISRSHVMLKKSIFFPVGGINL